MKTIEEIKEQLTNVEKQIMYLSLIPSDLLHPNSIEELESKRKILKQVLNESV